LPLVVLQPLRVGSALGAEGDRHESNLGVACVHSPMTTGEAAWTIKTILS
jgi:hypothetical protein